MSLDKCVLHQDGFVSKEKHWCVKNVKMVVDMHVIKVTKFDKKDGEGTKKVTLSEWWTFWMGS